LERKLHAQAVAEIPTASRGDLTIGGPTLAAEALRLDLVDVVELLWVPARLGGGIPVLPAGVRRDLTLRRDRRFSNGMGADHLRHGRA
jgi:dihydrofolate reductase